MFSEQRYDVVYFVWLDFYKNNIITIVCLPSLLCNCDPNTSICWIAILNCFITAGIVTQERKHAFSQTLKRGGSEVIFCQC